MTLYANDPSNIEPPKRWNFDFVEGPRGSTYVDDDLFDHMRRYDPSTFKGTLNQMDKVTTWWDIKDAYKSHFLTPIENGLVEVRFTVGSEVRFLGFVSYASDTPTVYVLCGFIKKTDRIPSKYLIKALNRKELYNLIRGPTT